MSLGDDDEDSLGAYIKQKTETDEISFINEDELEKDKIEEEEIFKRYETIGNLTDIENIKETNLAKNYDNEGNKYYNEYKYIKVLGKGSYSKVKLVEKDNIKYAMKIIDKKLLKSKRILKQDKDGNIIITNLLKDSLKEIAILKKLNHPNIIKLYEILHNYRKQKIYLILEYADYGDLVNFDEETGIFTINSHVEEMYRLRKSGYDKGKLKGGKTYYDENDIRHFAKQILLGLDYLHKNGIIHHDIKPNNILLCRKKVCKITDFNFSSILENLNEDNIGSNGDNADHFRAPETIHLDDEGTEAQEYQGKPLDIWAFGVTLYILTYLKFPFEGGDNILELYQTIKEAKFEFPIEPNYSRKMKYVIKKCLEKNPQTRKTADEILKILIAQKREVLDKYKPIFVKKIFSVIDLPVDELALGLDFFAEKCNAVFENPKDKDKPFIVKFEKKLNEYNIPKERFSKEVYKKIFSMKKMVKPPTDIKKEKEKEKEKEVKTENKGRHFISILNAKVKEVTITTTTTTTIETVETKIVKENGENEGKSALKKYIEEK